MKVRDAVACVFGEGVKKSRELKGWSQVELGNRLGVPQAYIYVGFIRKS